ncbi:MAG: Ser-Thr-rich GPI-anchored membrane family protein [Sumerlaeia bacterium]
MRLLLTLLSTTLALTSLAFANLVPNGDFETPAAKPNRPDGWSQWVDDYKVEPAALIQEYGEGLGRYGSRGIRLGHSYGQFLPIEYGTNNYARYRLDSGYAVPVEHDKYYRFSVWYRTENVTGHQAAIEIDMFDGSSFIETIIFDLPPSSDWREFTANIRLIRREDRGFCECDTDNLRIKLGAVSTLGSVRFDDVSLVQISNSEYNENLPFKTFTPDPLTARRGAPPRFPATGHFSVRRGEDGAWWMTTPTGRPMWIRSAQFTKIRQRINPVLYNNLPTRFLGNEITNNEWDLHIWQLMGSLGFNADAITDPTRVNLDLHPKGETFLEYLPLDPEDFDEDFLLKDYQGNTRSDNKPHPDPFNPNLQNFLRNYIIGEMNALGENGPGHPDFAGYFTENEIAVEYLDLYMWGDYSKHEFVSFMRTRYNNDLQAMVNTWNSSVTVNGKSVSYRNLYLTSFDDLLSPSVQRHVVRKHLDDPIRPDIEAFLKHMLKTHFRFWCETLRAYEIAATGDSDGDGLADLHYPIFTNRFELSDYPNRDMTEMLMVMDVLGELTQERPGYFYNVIAVNNYPGDEHFEGIRTQENFAFLEQLAQRAGIPVHISEFGVHARQSGIATGNNRTDDVGWFHRSVDTDADRGTVYEKMVRQWASSPYIIGAQWFRAANILQTNSAPPSFQGIDSSYYLGRNSGVIDQYGNPYPDFTAKVKATNEAIANAFELPAETTLQVTYPNGGERLVPGTQQVVRWVSEGDVGATVRIELLKGGTSIQTLRSNATNLGWYRWSVPASLEEANDYAIRITELQNNLTDTSDGTFRVAPADSFEVLLPAAGDDYEQRRTMPIVWEVVGSPTDLMQIDLYKSGGFNRTLAAGVPNSGSFGWEVDKKQALRDDYSIAIKNLTTQAETESARFDVVAESSPEGIVVNEPRGGETAFVGGGLTVIWESSLTAAAPMKLDLLRNGAFQRTIADNVPNTGYFRWPFIPSVSTGDGYRVRVTDSGGSGFSAESGSVRIDASTEDPCIPVSVDVLGGGDSGLDPLRNLSLSHWERLLLTGAFGEPNLEDRAEGLSLALESDNTNPGSFGAWVSNPFGPLAAGNYRLTIHLEPAGADVPVGESWPEIRVRVSASDGLKSAMASYTTTIDHITRPFPDRLTVPFSSAGNERFNLSVDLMDFSPSAKRGGFLIREVDLEMLAYADDCLAPRVDLIALQQSGLEPLTTLSASRWEPLAFPGAFGAPALMDEPSGLALFLESDNTTPGSFGAWVSQPFGPLERGLYQLTVDLETAGDTVPSGEIWPELRVRVSSSDGLRSAMAGYTTTPDHATRPFPSQLTVPFESTGNERFNLSIDLMDFGPAKRGGFMLRDARLELMRGTEALTKRAAHE